MTANYVTVTASWGTGAEGNFQFVASGSLMDSAAVAIVTPVIYGQLDTTGAISLVGQATGSGVQLLASDNFGADAAGDPELTWNVKIQVQGIPEIAATDIPVNYASGASQGLFSILEAAGWTAPVT